MSNNSDFQVGDYADFDGQTWKVKKIIEITSGGYKTKDPYFLPLDMTIYPKTRFRPFRSNTRLKQNSNPTLSIIKKVQLQPEDLPKIIQLGQKLRQLMADSFNVSPKSVIQILRGQHYFSLHGLLNWVIEKEETYKFVTDYLSLNRQLFLKYLLKIDFTNYNPSNIYSDQMNALCSCYPEMIEMLEVSCGIASEFNQFRNKNSDYFQKQLFEQQVHEWLESQLLANFVEVKHSTFSPSFLVALIASVNKISKTFQIEVSDPLVDFFQTLYHNYLQKLQQTAPLPADISNLSKYTLFIFKTQYEAQQNSMSQLRQSKHTDSSQTQKLQSMGEGEEMKKEQMLVVPAPLNKEEYIKQKQMELKFKLAYSYLKHGDKEGCIGQFNTCIQEATKECKECKVNQEQVETWPRTISTFFLFLKQTDFLERLLSVKDFTSSLISIRSSLHSLFPFIPKEISIACIKTGRSNILKMIIGQKGSINEHIMDGILKYVLEYEVPDLHVKDVTELIKYLQTWIKDKKYPHASEWRFRLLERQYSLALGMKHLEINIFDNLFSISGDDLRKEYFFKIISTYLLPNIQTLLENFNQYLLFKYVQSYSLSPEQFKELLQPMLQQSNDPVAFERRKMSIVNALHHEFKTNGETNHYYQFLGMFIDYYARPEYSREQKSSDWKAYSVYFGNIQNKKIFYSQLTPDLCQQIIDKILPLSSELDIKLFNDLFLRLNSCQGKVVLDDQKCSLLKVNQIPTYFEQSLSALYTLGKDELKSHQRYIQICFGKASGAVYYSMMEELLKIIILKRAESKEVNILFKSLKSNFSQLIPRTDNYPADFTVTFVNTTTELLLDDILNKFESDPYRTFLQSEQKNDNDVFDIKCNQTIATIKIKLAHKNNLEPCEITLLDRAKRPLSAQVEQRTISSSSYLFAEEAMLRLDRCQHKIPRITIHYVVNPEKSPIHQSLYCHAVQLFQLLPKSYIILQGIDTRVQDWNLFDKSEQISNALKKAAADGRIPEHLSKSYNSVIFYVDFFLWQQSVEEIKKYDFCFLLNHIKKIEDYDDTLFNMKIVYLIYLSQQFAVSWREQLLSSLLVLSPHSYFTDEEDDAYTLLSELVFSILMGHPEGDLEFCFTTPFVEKCSDMPVPFDQFKHYWKQVFEKATLEQKTEILNNIEERFNHNLPNMAQLGTLIEDNCSPELTCLYQTTLERMARYVVDLHRSKLTTQEQAICCQLLKSCCHLVKKQIRCDQLSSKQFIYFLTKHFYDYTYHIPVELYQLIQHCMKTSFHRQHLLSFFHQELGEEEWKKKDWLEIRKKYNEPQALGYVGMINCYNTCYANSLFQQLFHNELFCRELLAAEWQPWDKKPQEDLLLQLKKIFLHLKEDPHPYQNPDFFNIAFKFTDGYPVEVTYQVDVDEFRNLLFNHLESILPKNMFWSRIYEGKQDSSIKCLECGNISTTEQTFNSICLSIQDLEDLQASLEDHHKPLILEGDNAYSCQKCNRKVKAEKSLTVKTLPPELIFVLKRFEYVPERGDRRKLNDHFEFPLDQLEMDKEQVYRLKGIISHSGQSDKGHYISFIKLKEKWFEFNDRYVSQVSEEMVKQYSYGSVKKSQKESEFTAYLLFYQNIDHPILQNAIEIEEHYFGVQAELEKIRTENRLLNKETAFFNLSFLKFLYTVSVKYPSLDSLELLFRGLLQIFLKLRFPDTKENELYPNYLLTALDIIQNHYDFLPFIWNYQEQIIKFLHTTGLVEYKSILVYLLTTNLPEDFDQIKKMVDLSLSGIYLPKCDSSPFFVFMDLIASKSAKAVEYMHEQRIVGRILDLIFGGLISSSLRTELKESCSVQFQKEAQLSVPDQKYEFRYHKLSLLLFFLQHYKQHLHKSEEEYFKLLMKPAFLQRLLEEARTKNTIYFVGKLCSLLCQHCNEEFNTKLLQMIRDGLKKEKMDQLRKYVAILEEILKIKDRLQELRNQQGAIILSIAMKEHNYANDNSFELLWLWTIRLANGNQLLRKELAMNRSNLEFLIFKSYSYSAFTKASHPIKTRHRLYNIPVPLTNAELQSFYAKKMENTKAILNRTEHPSFDSPPDEDKPTVLKTVKDKILRFSDVTQTFEEFEVMWTLGDIIALKKPMNKEKFPFSSLLFKADERVVVNEQVVMEEEKEEENKKKEEVEMGAEEEVFREQE